VRGHARHFPLAALSRPSQVFASFARATGIGLLTAKWGSRLPGPHRPSFARATGIDLLTAKWGSRLLLEQPDGRVFITFAVFIRFDLGAIFVIVSDAERAAEFFGQRRLAEQAGLFEPVEVGQIAQARQSPQPEEGRRRHTGKLARFWQRRRAGRRGAG
jgi:hypothetical protein